MTSDSEPRRGDFECDRCSKCCRTHRVPITGDDVRRLVEGGHDAQRFVELLPPDAIDMEGEPESFVRVREGRRVLVLRHEKTNAGDGCFFLDESGCGVHPLRPRACRTYPYDRGTRARQLGLVPHWVCPEETGALSTLENQEKSVIARQFVSEVEARDLELEKHAEFVLTWNRRQKVRMRLGRLPESGARFIERILEASSHPS